MPNKKIGADEWMAELQRVSARSGDDGLTLEELATRSGRSMEVVRRMLKRIQHLGRLRSGRRATMSLDGRNTWTPVYWIDGHSGNDARKR